MLIPETYLTAHLAVILKSTHLEVGFLLRCLQQLSSPYMATQRLPYMITGTPEVRPYRSSRTK